MSLVLTFLCFFFYHSFDCLFFFFFQAEDGIRDTSVTGVQTCALPISGKPAGAWRDGRREREKGASRSEERRVGKSVDLGGRRIIKKKKKNQKKKELRIGKGRRQTRTQQRYRQRP